MEKITCEDMLVLAGKLIQYVRHTSDCEYEMQHHDTCICGVSALAIEYTKKLIKYKEINPK